MGPNITILSVVSEQLQCSQTQYILSFLFFFFEYDELRPPNVSSRSPALLCVLYLFRKFLGTLFLVLLSYYKGQVI